MKIKIDEQGQLLIERGGKEKPQWCQFCFDNTCSDNTCLMLPYTRCGDHCPHFGEPFEDTLRLCHGTMLSGEIVDERGK